MLNSLTLTIIKTQLETVMKVSYGPSGREWENVRLVCVEGVFSHEAEKKSV